MKKIRTAVLGLLLTLLLSIPALADSASFFSGTTVYLAAPVTDSPRILMIGNSLTYTNDLPAMLKNLCAAGGIQATVESVTLGGNSLVDYVSPGSGNGSPSLERKKAVSERMYQKLKNEKWDYVILQGKSDEATYNPQKLKSAVATLKPLIEAAGAQTVLYCTWAYDYKTVSGYDFYNTQTRINKVYYDIAAQYGCALAPSGSAFARSKVLYPDLDLYSSKADRLHPGVAGTYLSACCIYSTLFGRSPEGNAFFPNGTQSVASDMQGIAADVALRGYLDLTGTTEFSQPGYTINKSKSKQLSLKNTTYRVIRYTSEDPDVAVVSTNGKVTAKAYGRTVIRAVLNNGTSISCDIIVCSGKVTMGAGEKYAFRFQDDFTWTSSKSSVASAKNGKLTAKKKGTATLTGTNKNGTTVKIKVTVKAAPKKVTVKAKSLILAVGRSTNLKAKIAGGSSFYGPSYKSKNPSIVSVDENGIITAKRPGKTTITVKTYNGKKITCKVTSVIGVKKLAFSNIKAGATLKVGKSKTLKVTVTPSNASIKKLTWKSSNKKVLTVNKNGKVTAKRPGSATITATSTDGTKKSVKIKITVKKK